jgi:hypothetical protein
MHALSLQSGSGVAPPSSGMCLVHVLIFHVCSIQRTRASVLQLGCHPNRIVRTPPWLVPQTQEVLVGGWDDSDGGDGTNDASDSADGIPVHHISLFLLLSCSQALRCCNVATTATVVCSWGRHFRTAVSSEGFSKRPRSTHNNTTILQL